MFSCLFVRGLTKAMPPIWGSGQFARVKNQVFLSPRWFWGSDSSPQEDAMGVIHLGPFFRIRLQFYICKPCGCVFVKQARHRMLQFLNTWVQQWGLPLQLKNIGWWLASLKLEKSWFCVLQLYNNISKKRFWWGITNSRTRLCNKILLQCMSWCVQTYGGLHMW